MKRTGTKSQLNNTRNNMAGKIIGNFEQILLPAKEKLNVYKMNTLKWGVSSPTTLFTLVDVVTTAMWWFCIKDLIFYILGIYLLLHFIIKYPVFKNQVI